MTYIDCKRYANEILERVKAIPNKKALAILTVGDNPASQSYVKGKIKDCEYCGIPYQHIKIEGTPSAGSELFTKINTLNFDDSVGGIIIQLPLPNLPEDFFVNKVRFDKDVDGFINGSPFKPCTPEGIMYLLRKELGDLTGKKALVIGRGKLVGKPLSKMLLDADCTVTVAHSKSRHIDREIFDSDIIISAVGKPKTTNLFYCCGDNVVIDAGISRDANGKLVGDCFNFDESANSKAKVTPVPGGIGLMTRAMLMAHVARLDIDSL